MSMRITSNWLAWLASQRVAPSLPLLARVTLWPNFCRSFWASTRFTRLSSVRRIFSFREVSRGLWRLVIDWRSSGEVAGAATRARRKYESPWRDAATNDRDFFPKTGFVVGEFARKSRRPEQRE